MENTIQDYMAYLHNVKRVSHNTELSYERDLKDAGSFFKKEGISSPSDITQTSLNSYMLFMEKENLSTATVSRRIASLRSFFKYLKRENIVSDDPTETIKRPRVERKMPRVLTSDEVEALLAQPDCKTLKGLRDKAMLELMYATGLRVSELITLELADVELKRCYIVCHRKVRECWIPFGESAKKALTMYLKHARSVFLKGRECPCVFTNCSGEPMSRQGFWKVLKKYAADAGIEGDITPHTLRHSFAMHNLRNGADLRSVQKLLGHSDISTTAVYAAMDANKIRMTYDMA